MTGTTLVYSGRTTNWPVIAAAVAGGLALALFGRPWAGPWPGMLGPIAIALVALVVGLVTSTSLRVTTGPRGLQVRCGVFGWPRFAYPRERISGSGNRDGVDLANMELGSQLDATRRLDLRPALRPGAAIDAHQRPPSNSRRHRPAGGAGRTRPRSHQCRRALATRRSTLIASASLPARVVSL